MKKNLLLVGAGQLGSRHLQALSFLTSEYHCYVVDPSKQSLSVAEQRYEQIREEGAPSVEFLTNLEQIAGIKVKVCIVASNAAVRLDIIKQLIKYLTVDFLILEKILFQSIQQLKEACQLLSEADIKSWVNCPRRQFPAYKKLAESYKKPSSVIIRVEGVNWGLACNSIHFIDLWHYLAGFESYQIEFQSGTEVIDSKRPGFKELSGKLIAYSSDMQHKLELSCSEKKGVDVSIDIWAEINGENIQFSESEGVMRFFNSNRQIVDEKKLEVLFQSQLTHQVVIDLVQTGTCDLTSFDDSSVLHSEFLRKVEPFFCSGEQRLIPIT